MYIRTISNNFLNWVLPCIVTVSAALAGQIPGTAGDGVTDDSAAIQAAINSLPQGGVLDFGNSSFTYMISRSLTLRPNATYQGSATIRMSRSASAYTPIAILQYGQTDNVTITGLTLDANGVGGGINISVNGGWFAPANNIQITSVTFRNTVAYLSGGGDNAIYDPVGIQNSTIALNQFFNCGGGIALTDPNYVSITDNHFDTITQQDAIYLAFPQNAFAFGNGLVIARNTGRQITRMAVELWSPGVPSSAVVAPSITDNSFTDWSAAANPNNAFGMSIMMGAGAIIRNNTLTGSSVGLGIELGVPNATVEYNNITNFGIGITMYDTHGSTIHANQLNNQNETGINVAMTSGSRMNLTIIGNQIREAKYYGIAINASDWNGSTITGNTITRTGGKYPDDYGVHFLGINPWPNQSVSITGNFMVQAAATPPSGFSFMGLSINGDSGSNAGSHFDGNTFKSNAVYPFGTGVSGNSSNGLTGATFSQNLFDTLAMATSGATSVNVTSTGNRLVQCTSSGPLSPGQ